MHEVLVMQLSKEHKLPRIKNDIASRFLSCLVCFPDPFKQRLTLDLFVGQE